MHKPACFGGNVNSHVITIYIKRIEKQLAFDIVLHDYGEMLDDIKQYYISNKDD